MILPCYYVLVLQKENPTAHYAKEAKCSAQLHFVSNETHTQIFDGLLLPMPSQAKG